MQGPQAERSHTGQLPADFRYAHFPDTLSLNHQKKKKNSNKMCHLKNCLPLNQPWMISASNKMEARGPSAPLVYAEPASSWRASRDHFWDGFWGPKNPLKASPTSPISYRTSLRPCAFLSLHYPITTEKRSAPSSKHPTLIYLYTLMRSLLNLSLFPSSRACLFIANILRTLWMQAPDHESPPPQSCQIQSWMLLSTLQEGQSASVKGEAFQGPPSPHAFLSPFLPQGVGQVSSSGRRKRCRRHEYPASVLFPWRKKRRSPGQLLAPSLCV